MLAHSLLWAHDRSDHSSLAAGSWPCTHTSAHGRSPSQWFTQHADPRWYSPMTKVCPTCGADRKPSWLLQMCPFPKYRAANAPLDSLYSLLSYVPRCAILLGPHGRRDVPLQAGQSGAGGGRGLAAARARARAPAASPGVVRPARSAARTADGGPHGLPAGAVRRTAVSAQPSRGCSGSVQCTRTLRIAWQGAVMTRVCPSLASRTCAAPRAACLKVSSEHGTHRTARNPWLAWSSFLAFVVHG